MKIMWLVRLGGTVWHYTASTSAATRTACSRTLNGKAEWWNFGDWGDREICFHCQDAIDADRVVLVARGS